MKVLSIKEPFATLIKDGVKIYETRSWKTNYRGELYIHASLAISKSDNASSGRASKHLKSEIKPGYILCRCNLVDCIPMTEDFINYIKKETNESDYGTYGEGRYAWKLELLEVLYEPIPAKGKLGIWNY